MEAHGDMAVAGSCIDMLQSNISQKKPPKKHIHAHAHTLVQFRGLCESKQGKISLQNFVDKAHNLKLRKLMIKPQIYLHESHFQVFIIELLFVVIFSVQCLQNIIKGGKNKTTCKHKDQKNKNEHGK